MLRMAEQKIGLQLLRLIESPYHPGPPEDGLSCERKLGLDLI